MFLPIRPSGNRKVTTVYVYWNLLDTNICEQVLTQLKTGDWTSSTISYDANTTVNRDLRSCSEQEVHPGPDGFPYNQLGNIIADINTETWNFDLGGFNLASDHPSVFKYDAVTGDHFNWHFDFTAREPTRKLGFTLQFSDDADYDGGDLEFFGLERDPKLRQKGTLIVFPAFAWHRVTTVRRGTRLALVGWIHGPSFR